MPYIYKYTNLQTGYSYIGQTNNLQKRYNGHKSEAFNPKASGYWLPFHCAIRKYGLENFTYEVLEEIAEGESQSFIDEREKFFIEYYQTLISQKGYNVTVGGEGCPKPPLSYEEKLQRSKLFTGEEIQDIQQRLINDEEFDKIEAIYAPRLKRTFLVNINTGTNFFNPDFDYPLKKNSKSKFSQKEIQDIKNMIRRGTKYADIKEKYNISSSGFLSQINTGAYFFDPNETYPLNNKIGNKAQNEIWVDAIRQDILQTSLSLKDIAKKHNRSYSTVKNICAGRSHKKASLTYPLR